MLKLKILSLKFVWVWKMFKFEYFQNFQSKKKNKTNRTREEPNKKDKKAIKLNRKEPRPKYQRHLGRDMLL
jgi:hypothetical protein